MNYRYNARRFFAVIAMTFAILNSVGYAQPDVYLSFSAFGEGDAVSNNSIDAEIGESLSAYIWVDETFSIDDLACFEILSANGANFVEITGVEVFNPNIVDPGNGNTVVNQRWQAVSVGEISGGHSVQNVCGTAVAGGTGILPSQSSGNGNVDQLHDPMSNAFLFARLDLVVPIGGNGGDELIIQTGSDGGVIDGGVSIEPSYSSVVINVPISIMFGDINLDGVVSLLDVTPFIDLIFDARFQIEGDINMDGFVNVHDIPLFLVILTKG